MKAWILNRESSDVPRFVGRVSSKRNLNFPQFSDSAVASKRRPFCLSRRAKSKIRQLSKILTLEAMDKSI